MSRIGNKPIELPAGVSVSISAGRVMVNGDHQPARPFEWWKQGQFIRYATTLAMPRNPPKTTYTVWAGMFKSSKRAPVKAPRTRVENNAAAVATVEVAP